MLTTSALVWILAGYAWGSLSPAFIIVRVLKGIDLRHYGSGNVGSSNVGEQLGKAWTFVVGFIDLLKGLVPTALARAGGLDWSVIALVGLAVVVGHNWSLYLGLKGGRGLATILGVLLAWDPRLFFLMLIFFGLSQVIKDSGKGPLLGVLVLAPGAWLLGDPPSVVLAGLVLAAIIVLKRLEANRLPLPRDPREKKAVLWRRLWTDRDVSPDQPWQERKRFD